MMYIRQMQKEGSDKKRRPSQLCLTDELQRSQNLRTHMENMDYWTGNQPVPHALL